MSTKQKLAWALSSVLLIFVTTAVVLMFIVPRKNEAQQNSMIFSIRAFAQIIAKANDPVAIDIASKALMGNILILNATNNLNYFSGDAIALCIVAKQRAEFLPKMTITDRENKLLTAYFERAEHVLEPLTEIQADVGVLKPCLNPL